MNGIEIAFEATLATGGLLLEDVVQICLAAGDLAGAGDLETLLGTAVCLHLGHWYLRLVLHITAGFRFRPRGFPRPRVIRCRQQLVLLPQGLEWEWIRS